MGPITIYLIKDIINKRGCKVASPCLLLCLLSLKTFGCWNISAWIRCRNVIRIRKSRIHITEILIIIIFIASNEVIKAHTIWLRFQIVFHIATSAGGHNGFQKKTTIPILSSDGGSWSWSLEKSCWRDAAWKFIVVIKITSDILEFVSSKVLHV